MLKFQSLQSVGKFAHNYGRTYEITATNVVKIKTYYLIKVIINHNMFLLVKVNAGIKANGSCRLMTAFNKSFKLVKSLMSAKMANVRVGAMAIVRVNRTRFQRGHCKFKKPFNNQKKKNYLKQLLSMHNEWFGFILP